MLGSPYGVAAAPFAPTMGGYPAPTMGGYPGMIPPPVDATAFSDLQSVREEEDYTYWRDSGFKVPFLLFLIACGVTLFALTAWQANSDLSGIDQFGQVPRRLEYDLADGEEAGIDEFQRDIRCAVFVFAFVFVVLAFIVFFAPFKPVLRSRLNIFIAVILILTGILSWVVFGMDLDSLREVEDCTTNLNYTIVCESRESWLAATVVWDAGVGVFAIVSGLLLFFYSRSGDWTRQFDPKLIGYAEPYGQLQPGMYPNGVSFVRKWVLAITLLVTAGFAILMIVFTILIVESRLKLDLRDVNNRPLRGDATVPEGWRPANSLLRYAYSALLVLTSLIALIPFNSRVIAYVLGALFIAYTILGFTIFGLDVDNLSDAHDIVCPPEYKCVYHEYNATAAIDFITAFFLMVFVIVEFFVMHRRRPTASATIA